MNITYVCPLSVRNENDDDYVADHVGAEGFGGCWSDSSQYSPA